MKTIITPLTLIMVAQPCFGAVNNNKDNSSKLPNVILLVVDDMGFNDMSFRETALSDVKKYGTPAIDNLAAQGVFFETAYSTCPISSPARNGIITGCYHQRWGNYSYNEGGLDPNRTTIAQYLKNKGYATKKIGKVHLNGGPVQHPMDRGFDEFLGFINHTWDYKRLSQKDRDAYINRGALLTEINRHDQAMGALYKDRDPSGADYDKDDAYTTEIFTDEAVEFIERERGDQPFFIDLSYNALHNPTYVVDKKYAERVGLEYTPWDREADEWEFPYWDPADMNASSWHKEHGELKSVEPTGRKRYLSQLLALDDSVQKIIKTLKDLGELDNTIIVFVSDNGGEFAGYSNNNPLNGHKYILAEGGIRVPLMIVYPNEIKENIKSSSIVSAFDIFPTIADYVGGDKVDGIDGVSLRTVIENPKKEIHKNLVWDLGSVGNNVKSNKSYAVREGDWKYVYSHMDSRPSFKIGEDGMAYPYTPTLYPAGFALYNLKSDPYETNNVIDKYPKIVEKLEAIHSKWRENLPDPINMNKKK